MPKVVKTKNGCPFCSYNSTTLVHGIKGYQVECINCGARGPSGMASPEDAIKVWDVGDTVYKRPEVGPV